MYLKGKPDLDEPLYDSVKPFRKPKTSTLERQWKAIDQRDSPKNPKPQASNYKPTALHPETLNPKSLNPNSWTPNPKPEGLKLT